MPKAAAQAGGQVEVACYLLELLADQWLVLPAMYYRWMFPEQASPGEPIATDGPHSPGL